MSKKIVLVDGSSYLFRAYYALPPLITNKGQPTGAIYGVIKMLKNLYEEQRPDFFAVIFDAKGKTFRHDLYPEYKANRKTIDDDLVKQIKPLHNIIRALGYPLLMYDGVEADDVLGTLANKAHEQNIKTIISTGDKDLAQLVNSNINLINTMKNEILDETSVFNKFGVKPKQIIDFLALTGDASDNIKGVNKVGPKTASEWLNKYDNLDNIIANINNFHGKVGDYLKTAIDNGDLALAKTLVTIDCNVTLEHNIFDLTVSTPDKQLLALFYQEYQFKQWLAELSDHPTITSNQKNITNVIENTNTHYEIILSKESLSKWIEKLKSAPIISIDTETTNLDIMRAKLVGISFSVAEKEAAYLPLAHNDPMDSLVDNQLDFETVMKQLQPILIDKNIAKVGQNLKYDMSIFNQSNIIFNGITDDTMLQSYVLNSVASRHNLDTLANNHLNLKITSFETLAGKGKKQLSFNQITIQDAGYYAAEDADVSLQLYHYFQKQLEKEPKLQNLYQSIEIPLISVLSRIEQNGVLIDVPRLLELSQELGMQIIEIETAAYKLADEKFNLYSPKQVQYILFEKLNIPVIKKTPKGQASTAEDVLQTLSKDHKLPQLLLKHRSLSKLKSTYTDALPKQVNQNTGRIHTSYHQAVTATGRLSSSNPNLQNIPIRSKNGREIRKAFIAETNNILIAADYSQIELRIMAEISQDKSLIKAFQNNVDIHNNTASEIFDCPLEMINQEQRRKAKAINFGLMYGMSAFGLAKQIQVPQQEAKEYIEMYFSRYPKVKEYMENTKIFAREHGFVETLFGRKLFLSDISHKNNNKRKYAERTAINAPVQGTAADLMKMAMIEVDKKLENFKAMIIMQVHDELVIEAPIYEQDNIVDLLVNTMQNIVKFKVPLPVELGIANNWNDAH